MSSGRTYETYFTYVQNLFAPMHPFAWKLTHSLWKETQTTETEQDLIGLLGTKTFPCPAFSCLQEIGFIQPPRPSRSCKGQVQTVADQGREGMQRQGRNSQETIPQPWGRVPVPPQGIHITISLSSSADTETPTTWEKLTACCPQAGRPQTGWNQKVDDADSR